MGPGFSVPPHILISPQTNPLSLICFGRACVFFYNRIIRCSCILVKLVCVCVRACLLVNVRVFRVVHSVFSLLDVYPITAGCGLMGDGCGFALFFKFSCSVFL